MRDRIFLEEQCDAERQDNDGHNFDDPLQPRYDLTGFLFDVLRARGNPGNVIPVRDAVGPRAAGARDDEAAGQKQVARLFEYRVRLAGDERLVDLALAGKDDAVGADLTAVGKGQHVVQHNLVDGQRKLFAVADNRYLRLREEGELVDHALGADLLKNADGGVAEHNADEQSVFIGADRQNGDGQQQIDDVEQRQQVVAEDARVGLRLYAGVFVAQPFVPALGGLRVGQSAVGRGLISFRCLGAFRKGRELGVAFQLLWGTSFQVLIISCGRALCKRKNRIRHDFLRRRSDAAPDTAPDGRAGKKNAGYAFFFQGDIRRDAG